MTPFSELSPNGQMDRLHEMLTHLQAAVDRIERQQRGESVAQVVEFHNVLFTKGDLYRVP